MNGLPQGPSVWIFDPSVAHQEQTAKHVLIHRADQLDEIIDELCVKRQAECADVQSEPSTLPVSGPMIADSADKADVPGARAV